VSIEKNSWVSCANCQGRGKKSRRLRKKIKLQYQRELEAFEKANREGIEPERPRGHLEICVNCKGSGLEYAKVFPLPDTKNYPHIAIIGGGIGGVALAVACLHRGIPFTLFERDRCFDERSQGYGLTLQQASRAINGLGIVSLKGGVVSTRHVVHTTEGKMIGEWGIRKWGANNDNESPKRTNIHIARQSLRLSLIEQLGGHDAVQWNHQLIGYNDAGSDGVNLSFKVGDKTKQIHADLIVGADGIRSSVRRLLIGEEASPLRYLGCIAILGICPLSEIEVDDRTLLDSATVFQTANGYERIYIMPFTADSVMWQLSFPMDETDAKALSAKGSEALKEEAIRRCDWHDPIPQILAATQNTQVSGYPVYDRALLESSMLAQGANITLIGDAAHPMSPFKGQGANQALLDALALARGIAHGCRSFSKWREVGLRESVLTDFEKNMLERSATKVKDSADAAEFLHSQTVLHEGNEPRGRCLKRDN
jgi:2-polyprenyl-6-methoxyphenol hydroxylase-like FAD-dependent oxidoreductase